MLTQILDLVMLVYLLCLWRCRERSVGLDDTNSVPRPLPCTWPDNTLRPTATVKKGSDKLLGCSNCKTSQPHGSIAIQESSRLLNLPAELRNKIWDLALYQPGKIIVHRGLQQPPLLVACRQTRFETRQMWYSPGVSLFAFRIRDCDSTLFLLWNRHINAILSDSCACKDEPYQGLMALNFSGQPDWKNLMQWAYSVWLRDRGPLAPNTDYTGFPPSEVQMIRVILCVPQLADNQDIASGKNWKDLERDLEVVRQFANVNDPRW